MLEWARGMLRAMYFHLQKDESAIPHMFFMRRKIPMLLFGERAWVSWRIRRMLKREIDERSGDSTFNEGHCMFINQEGIMLEKYISQVYKQFYIFISFEHRVTASCIGIIDLPLVLII